MAFAAVFTAHAALPGTGSKVVIINTAGAGKGTLASGTTGVVATDPVAGAVEYSLGTIFGVASGKWTQPMVDAVNVEIEDLQAGAALDEEVTCVKTLTSVVPPNSDLRLSFCNVGTKDMTGGLRVILHCLV